VRIFLKRRFDDAIERVANCLVLREDLQRSVLDLLDYIRHSVGLANLHVAGFFINRGVVPVGVEKLAGEHEIGDDRILALGANIEVPRIVPPANVQPGMCSPGLKGESVEGPMA